MGYSHELLGGNDRRGHCGVHVAYNDNPVSRMLEQNLFKGDHHSSCLLRVRTRAHFEVYIGSRNLQVIEKRVAHRLVVMLSGMDEQGLDSSGRRRISSITGAIFIKFGRAPTTLIIRSIAIIQRIKLKLEFRPLRIREFNPV